MLTPTHPARPPSPWRGSSYTCQHRWQLEGVADLAGAVAALRALAGDLLAAHAAGWWLVEPMRGGHVLAARASRRQRASLPAPAAPEQGIGRPSAPRCRVRLIDEPPAAGDEVLRLETAEQTPVLAWAGGALRHVRGPAVAPGLLSELTRQVVRGEVERQRWGIARTRVGGNVDLLADGSALRLHAVEGGALVRTVDALTFHRAADGAASLPEAAGAYERLARTAEAAAAAGGRLVGADDGFLDVRYSPPRTR